jgi:hypothetical protein
MKLNTLFTITAVVTLAFGIGFLIAPGALLGIYGLSVDSVGVLLARFAGSAFICLAPLTWLAREFPDTQVRRALVISIFPTFAIGFVVALLAQISGLMNSLGWLYVALPLLFTLGYGYFLLNRSAA